MAIVLIFENIGHLDFGFPMINTVRRTFNVKYCQYKPFAQIGLSVEERRTFNIEGLKVIKSVERQCAVITGRNVISSLQFLDVPLATVCAIVVLFGQCRFCRNSNYSLCKQCQIQIEGGCYPSSFLINLTADKPFWGQERNCNYS